MKNRENGSALIYIFIGVALFGVLMFVFARGSQQNTSAINQKTNALSAAALIDESRTLESTVQKLIAAGCSENELSFDRAPYTANTNPNAPSDRHCHIFHPDGGKLNASAFQANWAFSGQSAFPNAGSTASELAAYMDDVDETTCQKINDLLKNGLTSPPTTAGSFFTASFDGTFAVPPTDFTAATDITAGCTHSTATSHDVFFKALLIR